MIVEYVWVLSDLPWKFLWELKGIKVTHLLDRLPFFPKVKKMDHMHML